MTAPYLPSGLSASELFSQLAERNQVRESELPNYSVTRTYEVRNASGKIQSQSTVLVRYDRPNPKEFEVLTETGSRVIASMVFRPLMQHEANASMGEDNRNSAIVPANYDVRIIGAEDLDGRHCFVMQATPRRRDKYLFEGTIWVDSQDLAIARIEGRPARNPSFWVRNVHFVRSYQKIGDFWLPREDTSVSDVKIFGKHTLTIRYEDYQLGDGASAANTGALPLH